MSSTYREIYNRMKEAYRDKTGIMPDDASDVGIRFSVLAGETYSLLCECEWLKRQMFADTASGESLDKHAQQRGITRKSATYGAGYVTFSVSEAAEKRITIPEATVVSTADTVPVSFITEEACAVEAGEKSVTVQARAVAGGKSGNAAKGKIKNIVTLVPYVETVTNNLPFSGGTDAESDEELRLRITESLKNPSNGTNIAYYKEVCGKINGVGSVGVIPRNRGAGTVDVFLAGQSTTASAQAVAEANRILSSEREVNVDAKAFAAKEKTVNLRVWVKTDGIHAETDVEERCLEAVRELIINSRVGEDILLSEIITKLMGLDGVEDVMFSSSYDNVEINDDTKAVVGTVNIDFI